MIVGSLGTSRGQAIQNIRLRLLERSGRFAAIAESFANVEALFLSRSLLQANSSIDMSGHGSQASGRVVSRHDLSSVARDASRLRCS
jgi:hypothetical protein